MSDEGSTEYVDLPIQSAQLASDLARELYLPATERPARRLAFVEDGTGKTVDLGRFRVFSVWTAMTPGGYPQIMATMQRFFASAHKSSGWRRNPMAKEKQPEEDLPASEVEEVPAPEPRDPRTRRPYGADATPPMRTATHDVPDVR